MTERPGYFIAEEMQARGWSSRDVALRMGGKTPREIARDELCVDLAIHINRKTFRLGDHLIQGLAKAFGVSPQLFENLEKLWLERGVQGGDAEAQEAPPERCGAGK